jgi:hypothetical protein
MLPTELAAKVTSVEFLAGLLGVLASLSVASERLVEIIKGLIPFLNQENKIERKEAWRCSILQIMAVGSGIITAFLAKPFLKGVLPSGWDEPTVIIALGFLASGGSGLWNGILTWVLAIKNLKKEQFLKLRSDRLKAHNSESPAPRA